MILKLLLIACCDFYTALTRFGYNYEAGKFKLGNSHSTTLFNGKKSIFVCNVPCETFQHYVIVMLDFNERKISFFDSARRAYIPDPITVISHFIQFLKDYAANEKKAFNEAEWTLHEVTNIAQQKSQPSCGIICLLFLEYLIRGEVVPKKVEVKNTNLANECRRRVFVTLINNHMYEEVEGEGVEKGGDAVFNVT